MENPYYYYSMNWAKMRRPHQHGGVLSIVFAFLFLAAAAAAAAVNGQQLQQQIFEHSHILDDIDFTKPDFETRLSPEDHHQQQSNNNNNNNNNGQQVSANNIQTSGSSLADDIDFTKPDFETSLSAEDQSRARFVVFGDEDDSILYRNPNRFEGDIAGGITPENVNEVVDGLNRIDQGINNQPLRPGALGNAVRNRGRIWGTKRVPYAISSRYGSRSRSRIAAAINEYGRETCIQFVARNGEEDYLYIEPDDGCYSMVGKSGGRQTVSIGSGCVSKGIIIHELMHALGFFHEQSRADRDDWVTINYDNIERGLSGQFRKYSLYRVDHLKTDYDYGSIMHYSSRAFSKNGDQTITAKKSMDGKRMGQRRGFSRTDVTKLKRLYTCPEGAGGIVPNVAGNTGGGTFTNSGSGSNSGGCLPETRTDCASLRDQGWCTRNVDWSKKNCGPTCNLCTNTNNVGGGGAVGGPIVSSSCRDRGTVCSSFRPYCNMTGFRSWLQTNCPKTCNFC